MRAVPSAQLKSILEGSAKLTPAEVGSLRSLLTATNQLHSATPQWPSPLHWSDARVELAAELVRLVHFFIQRGPVPHRLVAGIRGIGKTTFVKHLAFLLPLLFPAANLVVFFKDYDVKHVAPSAIVAQWMVDHKFWTEAEAAEGARDVMTTMAELWNKAKKRAVFFFDEVQQLFPSPAVSFTQTVLGAASGSASSIQAEAEDASDAVRAKRSVVEELKQLTGSSHAAVYCFGSAFHLVATMRSSGTAAGPGGFQSDKLPTLKILPLRRKDEFKEAWKHYAHASWRDNPGNLTEEALMLDAYMRTGGVYRQLALRKSDSVAAQQLLVSSNAFRPEHAILPLMYEQNRAVLVAPAAGAARPPFDPFAQVTVPKGTMMAELQRHGTATADGTEAQPSELDLLLLADSGCLFLDENLGGSFLLPQHYAMMENVQQGLTFSERIAIHFPQGRTLAEMWEGFYTEECVRRSSGATQLQLPPAGETFNFASAAKQSWAWFLAHRNTIYKLLPDTTGFGECMHSVARESGVVHPR